MFYSRILAFLLLPFLVCGLHSRSSPLVTITIDAPDAASSAASSPALVTAPASVDAASPGEQVIRIELVNQPDDWWSAESQLHFPKELSVRALLGFLALVFVCGLAVSAFLIGRWWQVKSPATPSAEPNFHRILA